MRPSFFKLLLAGLGLLLSLVMANENVVGPPTSAWVVAPNVPVLVQKRAEEDTHQRVLVLTEPLWDPELSRLSTQVTLDDERWLSALGAFKTDLLEDMVLSTDLLSLLQDHPGTPIMELRLRGVPQLLALAQDPRILSIVPLDDDAQPQTVEPIAKGLWQQYTALKNLRAATQNTALPNSTASAVVPAPSSSLTINPSVSPSTMLTLQKTGAGQGKILELNNDMVCDTDCTVLHANLPQGSLLRLQAIPAQGEFFEGWKNQACEQNQSLECTFTLGQSTTVTAAFGSPLPSLHSSLDSDATLNTEPLAPNTPVRVQAVGSSTYALQASGQLWVWGFVTTGGSSPVSKLLLSDVSVFSASSGHGLAIKTDGTLWAWGSNSNGQFGNGSTSSSYQGSQAVQVGTGFIQVAAGDRFSLGIKTDGTLWAWGSNQFGQLGVGDVPSATTPLRVGSNFKKVMAGGTTSMAIKTDNSLWAWGSNSDGVLGVGSQASNSKLPLLVGQGFVDVALQEAIYSGPHALAIKTDTSLWAWGNNAHGQLGLQTASRVPIRVGAGYAQVAAGNGFSVAIKTDGTLWSWGRNDTGQLGNGTRLPASQPTLVEGRYSRVSAGTGHVIAIQQGAVMTWGSNEQGQIGTGTSGSSNAHSTPVSITPGHGLSVRASWSSSAPDQNSMPSIDVYSPVGGIECSGQYNAVDDCAQSYEQGATVTLQARDLFMHSFSHWEGDCSGSGVCTVTMDKAREVSAVYRNSIDTRFIEIEAGDRYALAIDEDGGLWGWGYPDEGVLLSEPNFSIVAPRKISSGFTKVSAGAWHVLALKPDGSLWAWGRNDHGQLGDGTTVNQRIQPIKIGDGYTAIAAGTTHSAALKSDGSLWAWGRFGGGGNSTVGTLFNAPSPQMIGQNFSSVTTSPNILAAIAVDGVVHRWRSHPESPGYLLDSYSAESVIQIAAKGFSLLMLRTDGVVVEWSWPLNNLAEGPYTLIATPKSYDRVTFGLNAQNQLWGWGDNSNGQIGDGSTVNALTPKLISNNIAKVSAAPQYTLALTETGEILAWGRGSLGYGHSGYMALTPARTFILRDTHVLQIDLQGTGNGNVITNPGGSSCASNCSLKRFAGVGISLAANTSPGSVFAGWTGACSGTGTCQVTLGQDTQVGAIFNTITYPVDVNFSGNGGGRVTSNPAGLDCGASCRHAFGYDDLVVLQATPLPGHNFVGWRGDCEGVGACALLTYQARQVTAEFSLPTTFSLNLQVTGAGKIQVQGVTGLTACETQCEVQVSNGASVRLLAEPAVGFVFKEWGGACTSNALLCTVSLDQMHAVTAKFITAKQQKAMQLLPILLLLLEDD